MKILTTSAYNLLLEDISNLRSALSNSEKDNRFLHSLIGNKNQLLHDLSINFSIRRAIVGKQCSGKTEFIKSILPQIKNFYLLDLTSEWKHVPKKNRYDASSTYPGLERIIAAIKKNQHKVIIIDGIGEFDPHIKHLLMNMVELNYIISFQRKSMLEKYINFFDLVYDFGTYDDYTVKGLCTTIQIKNRP